jgi:TRAP-type C4-dicarboxylate transport system permease large subunit
MVGKAAAFARPSRRYAGSISVSAYNVFAWLELRTVGPHWSEDTEKRAVSPIITNAAVFSWLLTSEQIPQSMAEWMTAQGFGVVTFLLITNIVLLAAGNFMDPAAIVHSFNL